MFQNGFPNQSGLFSQLADRLASFLALCIDIFSSIYINSSTRHRTNLSSVRICSSICSHAFSISLNSFLFLSLYFRTLSLFVDFTAESCLKECCIFLSWKTWIYRCLYSTLGSSEWFCGRWRWLRESSSVIESITIAIINIVYLVIYRQYWIKELGRNRVYSRKRWMCVAELKPKNADFNTWKYSMLKRLDFENFQLFDCKLYSKSQARLLILAYWNISSITAPKDHLVFEKRQWAC